MDSQTDIGIDHLPFVRIHRDEATDRPSFADILSTDGDTVRRLAVADRQIFVQQLVRSDVAQTLAEHVQSGLDRGRSLVGYSLLDDARAACVRFTGDADEPGWLAYREKTELPSIITEAFDDAPSLRLVAGAKMHSEFRSMAVHVALEERGDPIGNVSLIEAIDNLSFHATRSSSDGFDFVRLGRGLRTPDKDYREEDHRRHLRIPIPSDALSSLLADDDAAFWLRVEFSDVLLALPTRWRRLHLRLRLR